MQKEAITQHKRQPIIVHLIILNDGLHFYNIKNNQKTWSNGPFLAKICQLEQDSGFSPSLSM